MIRFILLDVFLFLIFVGAMAIILTTLINPYKRRSDKKKRRRGVKHNKY